MKKEELEQHNAQADQLGIPNHFLRNMPVMSDELLRILFALSHLSQPYRQFHKGEVTISVLQEMTGLNAAAVSRGIGEGVDWELILINKRDDAKEGESEEDAFYFELDEVPRIPPPSLSSLVGWLKAPTDTGTAGVIYVLHNGHGLYKIGKTTNLQQRLKAYSTHSPYEHEVVVQIEVTDITACEADLLKRFKHRHERGEWFRLSDQDVAWLLDWHKSMNTPLNQ